jgi:hypothetical protein
MRVAIHSKRPYRIIDSPTMLMKVLLFMTLLITLTNVTLYYVIC